MFTRNAVCSAGRLAYGYGFMRPTNSESVMQVCNQDQTPTSFNGGMACSIMIASIAAIFSMRMLAQAT